MENERITIPDYVNLEDDIRLRPETLRKVRTEDLMLLIDDYVLSDPEEETIVSELESRIPGYALQHAKKNSPEPDDEINYSALYAISTALSVIGVIFIIIGLIGVITVTSSEQALFISITILITSLFSALSCFAGAQLIKVFINISQKCTGILDHLKKSA